MSTEGWIDLTEFAAKYRVSPSTLRRRIRGNTIAYRMDRGKYLLQDTPEALNQAPLFSRQHAPRPPRQAAVSRQTHVHTPTPSPQTWNPSPIEEEIKRLRAENKLLREQLAEVETLVKVLEAELQSYNA